MLMMTIFIGGLFMIVSALTGFILFYQAQQTTDFTNSTISIFAADAALEAALYDFFYTTTLDAYPTSSCQNGTSGPSIILDNFAFGNSMVYVCETSTFITSIGQDGARRTIRFLNTLLTIGQ